MVVVTGCSEEGPGSAPLATCSIALGSETFDLEIADRDETRSQGLMHRKQLGANEGMLFVFESQRRLAFWMKNTHIPLDIAFIRSDGRIVRITTMPPLTHKQFQSGEPCRFAIETPAGSLARAGVREGDNVQIPPELLKPTD